MVPFLVVLGCLAFVVWLIISWCNIVNPDEVALRRWFGKLEPTILTSGLNFVPWFPYIELVRIPIKFIRLVYERDPSKPSWVMSGNMIQVRSKDKQKLLIEAIFFLRFPYDKVEMLILMIKGGVPFDDEDKLTAWLAGAIDAEITTVLGDYNYADVIGGLKNESLNKAVNLLIQKEDSLLRRNGVFFDDGNRDDPGTGEAYIKFKYIHVSGPLGERLELVETAKLEAEAAQSVAENKAKVIGAPIEIMLERWVQKQLEKSGVDVADPVALAAMKKTIVNSSAYTEAEKAFHKLRSQEMAGGGTYHKNEIDINSAGQPIDPDIAGIIGTAAGIAAVFGATKGGSGSGSGKDKPSAGGKNKKKPTPPPTPPKDKDDDDEEDDDQDDSYKDRK